MGGETGGQVGGLAGSPADRLEAVWGAALAALGAVDGEAIERNWVVVEALYAHPPRAYHNLGHVAECLAAMAPGVGVLGGGAEGARRGALVRLALLVHDCIYDPRRSDNEARSAAVGVMLARDAGMDPRHEGALCRLVLATAHRGEAGDELEGLIRDVDLASLAADAPVFEANTRAIRCEFAWASEEQFQAGRLAFFQAMLARPAIYALPVYRGLYESKARANLARAVELMGG